MRCLCDSIRDDPSVQRLLRAAEDAPSLRALILATWQVARGLAGPRHGRPVRLVACPCGIEALLRAR